MRDIDPTLTFRPIEDCDVHSLLDLWVESWSEVMPLIDFEARRNGFIGILKDHRMNAYKLVGAFSEKLVGFIAVHPSTGDLDQICVSVAAKGSSVALDLLNHAKTISPCLLTLKVNAANPRAIRFYEREGFIRTGVGVNPRSGLPICHYRWQL